VLDLAEVSEPDLWVEYGSRRMGGGEERGDELRQSCARSVVANLFNFGVDE
jgi:hypothetical protein